MCHVGSAVRRRAAPYSAVRRRVRRVCRVATRRAVRQGRAVWRAVWHAVWSFYFPGGRPGSASPLGRPAQLAKLVCDHFGVQNGIAGHQIMNP
eukprot:gene9617-biopygen2838